MTAAYWRQWSRAEIRSMHGLEDDDADLCHDDIDADLCHEEQEIIGCCARGCMSCLGFSWRDFM